MSVRTSDEVKTMSNARTIWSIPRSLSGCERIRDEIRLRRNKSFQKRCRFRKQNIELLRKIHQMERLLGTEERYQRQTKAGFLI